MQRSVLKSNCIFVLFYNFQDMTVVLDKRGPSPAEIQPRPISENRLSLKVVTVLTNRAGICTKNPKSLRRQSDSHLVSGCIVTLLLNMLGTKQAYNSVSSIFDIKMYNLINFLNIMNFICSKFYFVHPLYIVYE